MVDILFKIKLMYNLNSISTTKLPYILFLEIKRGQSKGDKSMFLANDLHLGHFIVSILFLNFCIINNIQG